MNRRTEFKDEPGVKHAKKHCYIYRGKAYTKLRCIKTIREDKGCTLRGALEHAELFCRRRPGGPGTLKTVKLRSI